jgi:hypothetical protein
LGMPAGACQIGAPDGPTHCLIQGNYVQAPGQAGQDGWLVPAPQNGGPAPNSLGAGANAASNIPGLGNTPVPPVIGPQVASNGPVVPPGETQTTPPVDGEHVGNVWYESSCSALNGMGGCWMTFGNKIVDDPRPPAQAAPGVQAPPPPAEPNPNCTPGAPGCQNMPIPGTPAAADAARAADQPASEGGPTGQGATPPADEFPGVGPQCDPQKWGMRCITG